MKSAPFYLLMAFAASALAADPAKPEVKPPPKPEGKPAPKPPAKPAAKPAPKPAPKPVAKPQPSVKDLAMAEAKKCDLNGNGRIEGSEVSMVRGAFAKDPNSWLYLFDENGDKTLADPEIAKIELPKGQGNALPGEAGKGPSLKDRAIAAAKKMDANKNDRIESSEVSELRGAFAKDGKASLSFFDENRNGILDDAEIARIRLSPPKPEPEPKKDGKKDPKKKK
jgi:hypothetical protein